MWSLFVLFVFCDTCVVGNVCACVRECLEFLGGGGRSSGGGRGTRSPGAAVVMAGGRQAMERGRGLSFPKYEKEKKCNPLPFA